MVELTVKDPITWKVRAAAERLRTDLNALLMWDESAWNEQAMYNIVDKSYARCLSTLAATELWGPANRLPSSEFWSIANDFLAVGWLQHQAWQKPRGYAGDFEMLQRIHDRQLSEHRLGRLFDQYFHNQAAPQAVRNRMQMVTDWIVARVQQRPGPCRAVSYGSGPGLDLLDAAKQLSPTQREQLHFTLLDLDPQGVESSGERLSTLLRPEQIVLANENLFRLAKNPRIAERLKGADQIFCTGLFDYLDDAAAATMLRIFWEQLAPGGEVYVFNFSPNNPSRAYMEWFGNWYLVYRDENQMEELTAGAGIPARCCSYGAEAQGVNLYLAAVKD